MARDINSTQMTRRIADATPRLATETPMSPEWTLKNLEAPPGFEPGMEVLQTSALPLGDGAGWDYLR